MRKYQNQDKNKIPDKPWLSNSLKNACKKKNYINEVRYKTYKNKLSAILKKAKRQYFTELLQSSKTNIKNTWKIMIKLIGKVKSQNKYPEEFRSGDIFVKGDKCIANAFNKFFTNIGPALASKIKLSDGKYDNYMGNRIKSSIFLNPVTELEIINIVNSAKTKYSKGFDDISMALLKALIKHLAIPLAYIFNLSFLNGVFPNKCKIAKVIPLYKNGDIDDFSNYRPVSLLPQFSKILEKLFNNRLKSFMKVNHILSNNQYGFREDHSTNSAIIELIEEITSAIDNSMSTVGVFIDLKKAFDTKDHGILLKKLEHYGIRGIANQWVSNYLTERFQYVQYNNISSDYMSIKCGVPQGSILGPTLFLLYINDICRISTVIKMILFADDTNLFYSGNDLLNVCNTMSSELGKLNKWFQVNKLSLNIQKTNFMIFGNKKEAQKDYIIHINNQNLERVFTTKFLGIYIDSKLTWQHHINIIRQKIAKNVAIIYRVKNFINISALLSLYFTLISPYLHYCCEIKPLTILQKKALRLINNDNSRAHSAPIFYKFNILNLQDLVKFKTLILMFKAKQHSLPNNIRGLFEFGTRHNYETRQKSKFKIKYCRTTQKLMCISIIGPKLWNDLEKSIQNSKDLYEFKKTCKKYMILKYLN